MTIPNRLFNIAKTQLDKAVERWDQIDAKAQQEIDAFMATHADNNQQSAWERAKNKIGAGTAESELRPASSQIDDKALQADASLTELEAKVAADSGQSSGRSAQTGMLAGAPPQTATGQAQERTRALVGAYKMLGLEPGADWAAVKTAYNTLRERASPERFAANSPEQETAVSIQRRIDAAYMMISGALASSGDRFDRLEL